MTAYDMASLRLADAISRHDFTEREWRILEFLRKASFGAGRPAAYVPRMALFCVATSITRGNVSSILRRLKACRVIREEPEFYYGFLLLPLPGDPCANWRVPVRTNEVEVIRQLELLPPPPGLPEALRDGFIESCTPMGNPGTVPGTYETRPVASVKSAEQRPAHTGVPESGTPAHHSRIGNGTESPMLVGLSCTVPESGTAHVTCDMQQCSNAPSMKHTNIVTCASVPESGTGVLNSDRQELMDRLLEVGAFSSDRADSNRPCWLGMVRKRPSIVSELLGELEYAQRQRAINKPGAWMMDKWKRWGRPND